MNSVHNSPHSAKRRLQHPQRVTPMRGVRQDKPLPTAAPPSYHPGSPAKKLMRPAPNERKKYSTKRRKVKAYIWLESLEKKELERIAQEKQLSVSETGRAFIVDGIRRELRNERDALAAPILEAMLERHMNRLINHLSEFQGRSIFELGQLRWLFVNKLYREVINPEKKFTKEEFYKLLDKSQKETIKRVKQWNPDVRDVVAEIKKLLKEGEGEGS